MIGGFIVACTENVRTSTTAPRYLSTGNISRRCLLEELRQRAEMAMAVGSHVISNQQHSIMSTECFEVLGSDLHNACKKSMIWVST